MTLAVLKGYQDKSVIIISSVPYAIGRCRSADFIIVDVNVSRNHCKIEKENGEWKINDFSSSGTYINDALVGKGKSATLNDGDFIRFGPLESNLCWVFHSFDTSHENSALLLSNINKALNFDHGKHHLTETNSPDRIVRSDVGFEEKVNEENQMLLRNFNFTRTVNEIEMKQKIETDNSKIIKDSQNVKLNTNLSTRKEIIKEKSEIEKIKELTKELEEVRSALDDMEEKNSALQVELAAGAKDKTEIHMANNLMENLADLMEAEFQCTICSELFVTAVTLSCTHTFCKYCINQWKKKQKTCPVCRKKITNETRSLVVDNYIDKVVGNLSPELKERRDIIIKERKEMEPCKKKSKLKK